MKRALSRTKIELFLNCPRCFWLDIRASVKPPPGFPFNLNSAVDHLLKNEFDRYRGGATVPPRLQRAGVVLFPAAHPELPKWRRNFNGVRVEHGPTGLTVYGAIDDLWVDGHGTHFVVDYKATSKKDEVSLDADWQDGYRRQVEFYQWLLRGQGLKVSDRAWFVYANGIRDNDPFDDLLRFRTKVMPYDGNAGWVEPVLHEVAGCLAMDRPPAASPACEYCSYVARASAVL